MKDFLLYLWGIDDTNACFRDFIMVTKGMLLELLLKFVML